jgi:hypothetical protein
LIFRLRERVAAGPLADEESLRAPRESQQPLVDERIEEHEIRVPQPCRGTTCNQIGVAGPGTDERDKTEASNRAASIGGVAVRQPRLPAQVLRLSAHHSVPIRLEHRMEWMRARTGRSAP